MLFFEFLRIIIKPWYLSCLSWRNLLASLLLIKWELRPCLPKVVSVRCDLLTETSDTDMPLDRFRSKTPKVPKTETSSIPTPDELHESTGDRCPHKTTSTTPTSCQPLAIPSPGATGKPHNSDTPNQPETSVSTSPQTKEVSAEARQQPSCAALRRPASCSASPHSVGFQPLEETWGVGRPIRAACIQFSATHVPLRPYEGNFLSYCSVSYHPSVRKDEVAMCESTIDIPARHAPAGKRQLITCESRDLQILLSNLCILDRVFQQSVY